MLIKINNNNNESSIGISQRFLYSTLEAWVGVVVKALRY